MSCDYYFSLRIVLVVKSYYAMQKNSVTIIGEVNYYYIFKDRDVNVLIPKVVYKELTERVFKQI